MRWVIAVLAIAPALVVAAPYDDCILQNMKGVQAQNAASAIARACREKTTPKKCRYSVIQDRMSTMPLWDKFDYAAARKTGYSDAEIAAHLSEECVKDCAASSYWSRTFGECSTD